LYNGDSILVNFIFIKWSRVRISSRPSIDILIFVLYNILYIGDSSLSATKRLLEFESPRVREIEYPHEF